MKRYLLLFLSLFLVFEASAQNISVKSFRTLPMDMTASSLEGKRIDQNGDVAALIKVVTNETGFLFEGGALGIVDTKQNVGEVWVWVPRGLRKITIKHQQLGVLRDYLFPVEIEAERTYEMVLMTEVSKSVADDEKRTRKQYLVFQITPPEATLEVNDQLWSVDAEGTAMRYVDFGTYSYFIKAANYFTEAGKVTVDDFDNTRIVQVNLKPNIATVTLTVDADAEIWVNNIKKGVRKWTGRLGNDSYWIECRMSGHESTSISQEITLDMEGDTIVLPVPKPIYGSLLLESTPGFATVFIDGENIGDTPKSINEILVGHHEIKITKDGYADYTETVTIKKGETKRIQAVMQTRNNLGKGSGDEGSGNGTYGGHNYVDLGLPSGTLWATCNVGASFPEEYGSYYAWGETTTKSRYDLTTYKYANVWRGEVTKYCFTDTLTILQSRDDVASNEWGSGWRMPTKEQWVELLNHTTNVWTFQNGVKGWKFTASNGNSIFLPAAGFRNRKSLDDPSNSGYYWSSSLADNPNDAWYLYFISNDCRMESYNLENVIGRDLGYSVRPVRSTQN